MDRKFTGAGNSQTLMRFAPVSPLGYLEFEGIAATDALCDDGYALSIPGGDISRFSDGKGPLLLEHKRNQIIGTASLRKTAHAVILNGEFASPGVSQIADDARRLLKDGVLRGLSMTFAIKQSERMGGAPGDGRRVTKWTALEVSLCSVPMDAGAVVTARAMSEFLARSGRRLSAETERRIRAALESHSSAMSAHRDVMTGHRATRDMLEAIIDRNDSGMDGASDGIADESERARRQYALAVRQRRWPPGTLAVSAVHAQRQRQLQQRELVIRRIP